MSNFNPKQPYNQLPLLPPGTEIETKTVLKQCVLARVALAELDSSEIEQIVTTTDKLFWILYILKGVEQTAQWTRHKIAAIRSLMAHTAEHVKITLPSIYSHELVNITFTQPYCRITNLVDENIAKRQTASEYLKQLCNIGVLEEMKVGREKLFIHPKFMTLLTHDSNEYTKY